MEGASVLTWLYLCHMPGNIQGQVGWGTEQPDPVQDFPAYFCGTGLDNL